VSSRTAWSTKEPSGLSECVIRRYSSVCRQRQG